MTKVPTISLSRSRDIPFNKLVLSQANVRKTKVGVSIEELAEDIARRTLLQSLSVRPVLDAGGAETGMFEVPAGGRRYRALELLVKRKQLARNALIPCVVRTSGLAEEDSYAENMQRAPLHALDQFRAFQILVERGQPEEEIAVAFNTTVAIVRQRLRLAAVAPALLDVYADDGLSLDQLMAFTVNPDPERQLQVWEMIQKSHGREAFRIRRLLTEGAVRASDRRAQFVLDEYKAAGGAIMRDLFEADQGGWLQDPGLLERLVLERLALEGQTLAREGWKWVETAVDFPYGHIYGLRHLTGEPAPLSAEENTSLAALQAEQAGHEEAYADADEYPEAIDQRLAEIETAIDALRARPVTYGQDELAIAGAFLSIDNNGQPRIERGFVLPQDEPAPDPIEEILADAAPDEHDETAADETDTPETPATEVDEPDDPARPLPDRLVSEMSVHRTLALRDALAGAPDLAFLAVLHALCLALFSRGRFDSCLEIDGRMIAYSQQGPGLGDTPCALAIEARHKAWADQLPRDPGQMWDALTAFEHDSRQMLFAHCAGMTVNALYEGWNRRPRPLAHADILAQALDLDMNAAGWSPTVETFLGRVTKSQVLQAVREAKGEDAAAPLASLKKDEMAEQAARLLVGSGWLPKPLRTPARTGDVEAPIASPAPNALVDAPPAQTAEIGGETAIGPEPRIDDGDEALTAPHQVAAE
jgi:ParB family chromosome partitioning protein